MEYLKVEEEFDKIYIEKCRTKNDVELKFKELILLSGLDITYDLEKEEFYLNIQNNHIRMNKGNGNVYYISDGSKFIGVSLEESYLNFGLGTKIEIFIKDEGNFQEYCFRQNYFDDGGPWFYYDSYIDGKAFEFSSNGHKLYIREANTPLRSTYDIASNWNESVRVTDGKLNAKMFSFGGTEVNIGYGPKGERLFDYIPSVESRIIKNNFSIEHSVLDFDNFPQLYEVAKQYYHSGQLETPDYPGYSSSDAMYLDKKNETKTFKYGDPELMKFCIKVAQMDENVELFGKTIKYLSECGVEKYTNKYFKMLIEGIKFYQNCSGEIDLDENLLNTKIVNILSPQNVSERQKQLICEHNLSNLDIESESSSKRVKKVK